MNSKRRGKKKIYWEQIETWVAFAFIALYSLAAISVSLHRFWQYDAFWYDYGILDETIWRLAHFQLPVIPTLNPPQGNLVWGDHFNPTLILLSPIYWLTSRAEALLVAQVMVVSASAVVVYLIAKKLIQSRLARLAIVVSYLGFVGMQNALYTDIHNIVFATLPFTLAFWAIYKKRWRLYWLFFLLTLGVQENMALVGVGVGLFLFLRRQTSQKVALASIIISLGWGVMVTRWLMPALSGHAYPYAPEIPPRLSYWISGFFIPVDMKLRTIIMTILSFGILPFFSLPVLPLVLLHYLERFVLNQAATRWDLGFHYNVLLSPILAIGALEIIASMEKTKTLRRLVPYWGLATIGVVVFLHRLYLHGPLLLAHHPVFYEQTRRAKFLEDFVQKIPRDGLLMTQNNLATHFTHDRVTLLSRDFERIAPDYVAVDIRDGQNANDFFPLTPYDFEQLVASLSASPSYRKEVIREDQLLFVRK